MTKKKTTQIHVSQEDNTQAQHILEQYHQIADDLHVVTSREQAEAALASINSTSEAVQMALLKALSTEHDADAADVLIAINELSPIKNVRKEAKRSLIRLEEARIYPSWSPPGEPIPLISLASSSTNPPRFWKGIVTDTMEQGEVQLLLCWEQGEDYKETRVLGFLLDFWHDGVKDFFTTVESKRSLDKLIDRMKTSVPGIETVDCTLAKGRRLIKDALAINKTHGTVPARDYQMHLSLVNELIMAPQFQIVDSSEALDLEEIEDDYEEQSIIDPNWTPMEVVTNFVNAWVDEDYGLAYDLLTGDSSLHEGLARNEWIERREAWADKAEPENLQPNFIYEREPQKSGIWLPSPFSASRAATRKEVEAGWSIELAKTTPSETSLPELPQATAVYQETGRHWFWTTYILVQENNEWRIQSMADEGKNAQSLAVAELKKQVEAHDKRLEEITKKHKPTDPDASQRLEEILRHLMQSAYYTDVLLKHVPFDRMLYQEAAARMILFNEFERSLVYLEALHRFQEESGDILRQIGAVQIQLSESYFEDLDDERAEHFQELAEANLRESLALEDHALGRMVLAELLVDRGEHLDEATDHLHQALALTTNPIEEAAIETKLGDISIDQEEYEQALEHYQRVAEMAPDSGEAWANIGEAYAMLKDFEEAEANYRHALELEGDEVAIYSDLSRMYFQDGQLQKAAEVLEEGLRLNPDSPQLRAYLASVLATNGNFDRAEELLDEAEDLDPDLPMLPVFRQIVEVNRLQQEFDAKEAKKPRQIGNVNKPNKPNKRKKR